MSRGNGKLDKLFIGFYACFQNSGPAQSLFGAPEEMVIPDDLGDTAPIKHTHHPGLNAAEIKSLTLFLRFLAVLEESVFMSPSRLSSLFSWLTVTKKMVPVR